MRQKQRLRHKAQRCKKHPRSRQGWVLLHPMFPMKLSEYCSTLVVVKLDLTPKNGNKASARMRGLSAQIRRTSEQLAKMPIEQTGDLLCMKLSRRRRWGKTKH